MTDPLKECLARVESLATENARLQIRLNQAQASEVGRLRDRIDALEYANKFLREQVERLESLLPETGGAT